MKKLLLFSVMLFVASSILSVALLGSVTATSLLVIGGSLGLLSFVASPSINKASQAYDTLLPIQDARSVFTAITADVYREMPMVGSFLRSLFPPQFVRSKNVSISVQRGTELVAVDVIRGSRGNRNKRSKSTQSTIKPPYYSEYFDATDLDLYDVALNGQTEGDMLMLSQETAIGIMDCQHKIDRAWELQCAQVLQTGIIQLNADVDIDFRRKAESLVPYSAAIDFSIDTVDPTQVIETGCKFVRNVGKSNDTTFNVILGSAAMTALLNNKIFKERADIRNFQLDKIAMPITNTVGGHFHGQATCGSFTVNLWTYTEVYENEAGEFINYIDDFNVIVLPLNTRFKTFFALVPQLITDGGIPQTGEYLVRDFIDHRKSTHEFVVEAAPVATPIAIDQIWTATVLD